jgi:hypothetical protein
MDQERNDRLRVYRRLTWLFTTLFISIIPTALGVVICLFKGEPLLHGLFFGLAAGLMLTYMYSRDPELRQAFDEGVEEDFDTEERESDEAWARDQRRPDDEYVGW